MATRTARRRRPPDNDADNNDAVLKDLLVRELQDLYDADKQLIGAFGRLARAAEARPVVKLCREGVSYTKERVRRLDRVFTLIEMPARGRRCDGMRGLIRNAIQRAQENRVHAITDVGIMKSVQQISFYGLSGYSAACLFAAKLGEKQALGILRQSLSEKRSAVTEEAQILRNLVKRRR